MDQAEGRADLRIAQAGEPATGFLRQAVDVAAHHLDEHQLRELGKHRLAPGALVPALLDRHVHQARQPAPAPLRHRGVHDSWQRGEQRVERAGVAAEKAADEAADVGTRLAVHLSENGSCRSAGR